MQFPYDPNYGDSQSQSSHTAADHLVQEVGVKVADQVFFSTLIATSNIITFVRHGLS